MEILKSYTVYYYLSVGGQRKEKSEEIFKEKYVIAIVFQSSTMYIV